MYVLIDLKINDLKIENVGQMNIYLNYYRNKISDENGSYQIGIILCTNKNNTVAEYVLDGLKIKYLYLSIVIIYQIKNHLIVKLKENVENK